MSHRLRLALVAFALAPLASAASASTFNFSLAVAGVSDVDTGAPIPFDPTGDLFSVGTASITLAGATSVGFQDFDETDLTAFSVTIFDQTFGISDLADISSSTVPPPFDGPGIAFDAETNDGNLTSFVFGFTEVGRVASPFGGAFQYTPGSLISIDRTGVLALTGVYSSEGGIAPGGSAFAPVAVATLAPIPLPASVLLLLGGLAGLGAAARARR